MADLQREHSYGTIPFRQQNGDWLVLLIQHRAGNYWAFPKGGAHPDESPQTVAERELLEETGLRLKRLLAETWIEEHYQFERVGILIDKTVLYCIAEVEGTVQIQEEEVLDYAWLTLDKVEEHLTFSEARGVWTKAQSILF